MRSSDHKNSPWNTFWKIYPGEYNHISKTLKNIGYTFIDNTLLYEALCHTSANFLFSNLHPTLTVPCNEKLEFLGDAVIELTISNLIYKEYPLISEGELSKLRSYLVKKPTLAKLARQIELNHCICLSHSEKKSGGSDRDSILSDAFEALIGSIFLDSDYNTTNQVITKLYDQYIGNVAKHLITDNKSKFQEKVQRQTKKTPIYKTLDSTGPDHLKSYHIGVYIESKKIASAWGANKKEASQNAALVALDKINSQNDII